MSAWVGLRRAYPPLSKIDPLIAEYDRQEREAVRQHKAVRPIREAKRRRLHAHLERGRA